MLVLVVVSVVPEAAMTMKSVEDGMETYPEVAPTAIRVMTGLAAA